jgi:quaternary ammonium compound-resistance protein SugE
MAWLALLAASGFEVAWAAGLKGADVWSRALPAALTILNMVMSAALLGYAMRTLPLGTTYAIWTGLGTVGTTLLGVLWFGEPAGNVRLLCIGLILLGTVGLKLA